MARLIGKIGDWVEIERPAEAVFAAATNLESLLALARERGKVDAERIRGAGPTAVGDRCRRPLARGGQGFIRKAQRRG